jgi:hypothetical protein
MYSALNKVPKAKEALGGIIANWGLIEHAMVSIIACLLKTDFYRAFVLYYSSTNHKAQRDLIRSLAKNCLTDEEGKKAVTKIVNRIKSAADKRNDYVHGQWAINEGTGEIWLSAHRPLEKVSYQERVVTIKEIERDADFIAEVGAEVLNFAHVIVRWLPALPSTPLQPLPDHQTKPAPPSQ